MNVRGSLAVAGNTLLTCPGNVGRSRPPGRRATESCLGANNNDQDMKYVNVDAAGHFDSSTATLSIPSDARVVRAYLYWGADLAPGVQNGAEAARPGRRHADGQHMWRRALFRVGTGSYSTIDATDPRATATGPASTAGTRSPATGPGSPTRCGQT